MRTALTDVRGFTLVELVVVVAIGAVLIGIGAAGVHAWSSSADYQLAASIVQATVQTGIAEARRRSADTVTIAFDSTTARVRRNGVDVSAHTKRFPARSGPATAVSVWVLSDGSLASSLTVALPTPDGAGVSLVVDRLGHIKRN
jgi:prepilin-type N-terminal cleavage/methylation domain-containing protein